MAETDAPTAAPGAGKVKRVRERYGGYNRALDVALDDEVTQVGRGTPGGEYLRRTWQPVCLSAEIGELPKAVTMLGEELVAFRTLKGAPGLVAKHCSHRGASLEYGLATENGIQCCYHGWEFAPDGEILETPNDPESRLKQRLCHPAYPTHEYNGIVFAWMGPPEEVPEFPILDSYVQPDIDIIPFSLYFPCNWVQVLDNTQDPIHSCFLHTRISGPQFSISWGELPELEYVPTPTGMININVRRWKDKIWVRTTDSMIPNMNQTGPLWLSGEDEETFLRPSLTRWMRPIDDTHTQMIGWRYFNEALDRENMGDKSQVGLGKIDFVGQTEDERPYEERQKVPGDYEAIAGQGKVASSTEWNLNRGDRGVIMLRRIIRENIRAVRDGKDYVAIERIEKVDGIVPTYTQDTVVTIPQTNEDDRALMREVRDKVAKIVFDTAGIAEGERTGVFAGRLAEMMKDY